MNASLYRMARPPERLTVRRRPDFPPVSAAPPVEIVAVDSATECHVTPPDVARRMVDYLGAPNGSQTLEPSAGTGNLSRALIAAGYSAQDLTQVERHWKLAAGLDAFGAVVQRCFLEYAEDAGEFGRVIMNPPFSDVRKHIAAARGLLARGGCLVALVPITFETAGAETLETLPDDTFATARVRTKIIRIYGEPSCS